MLREVLRAKIHRATVTDANLAYEGSLTLAPELAAAAGLAPFEKIAVYNVTNGARFETYLLGAPEAPPGTVVVNGAAAHLAGKGDIIIIAAYGLIEGAPPDGFRPRLVYVDAANRPVKGPGGGA